MNKKSYEFNFFGRLTAAVGIYAITSVLLIWAAIGLSYFCYWVFGDNPLALLGIPVLLIGAPCAFVGGIGAGAWLFEELIGKSHSIYMAPVIYLANLSGVFIAIGLVVGLIYGLLVGVLIYAFFLIFLYAAAIGGVGLAVATAT